MTIVWINGPFGAGKSTLASALHADWPEAVVCDPEHLGFVFQRLWLPDDLFPGDFQHLAAWRQSVVAALSNLVHEVQRPLIVPMTLLDPAIAREIRAGLRQGGVQVHTLTLLASKQTCVARTEARGDDPSWVTAKHDEHAEVLDAASAGEVGWLGHVIDTDALDAAAVLAAARAVLPDPLPATPETWPPFPRKRVGAGALVRDRAGRVLVVDPVYKPRWEVPGGLVEMGESPRTAVIRELEEELGRTFEVGELLVVDHVVAHQSRSAADGVMFIFDGGTTDEPAEAFDLPPDELGDARFVDVDELGDYLVDVSARRLSAAVEALARGRPLYLD